MKPRLFDLALERKPEWIAARVVDVSPCWDFVKDRDNETVLTIAPPWPQFFLEVDRELSFSRFPFPRGPFVGHGLHVNSEKNKADGRWHLDCSLFLQGRVGSFFEWLAAKLVLNADGSFDPRLVEIRSPLQPLGSVVDPDRLDRIVRTEILGLLATIQFLHCKNISLREIDPYEGKPKSWRKHFKRPLVRYHTLEIDPTVLCRSNRLDASEGKRALHVCRGHFADYRHGNGLFGRLRGLFWVDQHVRGSYAAGFVDKDYRVYGTGLDGTRH